MNSRTIRIIISSIVTSIITSLLILLILNLSLIQFFIVLSIILVLSSLIPILLNLFFDSLFKNRQRKKVGISDDDVFSFDEMGFFAARLSIISELSKESSLAIFKEMDSMSQDLEKALSNIMNLSKEVSSIDPIVKSNIQLSQKLILSMNDTLEKFQSQISSIQHVDSVIPGLIQKSSELGDNSKSSVGIINSLQETANEGNTFIKSNIESIEDIDKMQKEFEGFMKIISDISEITGILSINASIEAANSGVSGKGFSIIADEVRKLSLSSSKQIDEASKIIKDLKGKIEDGVKSSGQVVQSFSNILNAVSDTVNISRETTNFLEKQNQEISEVRDGITRITSITKDLQDSIMVQNDDMLKFNKSFETLEELSGNIRGFMDEHEVAAANINGSISLLKDISNDSSKNSKLLQIFLEKDNLINQNIRKPIVKDIGQKKVGFIFSAGGLGDDSYNDMMFSGFVKLRLKGFFPFEYTTPRKKELAYADIEEKVKKKGCKFVIVAIGHYKQAVIEIAKKHPDVNFALIDDSVEGSYPNITSIFFYPHESSFLAGCLAALCTKTNRIAFVGGTRIPPLLCFKLGFEEGIKHINRKIDLQSCFLSEDNDFTGFNNPEKAHETAMNYFRNGVDIIFSPSGRSSLGVISAVKEANKFMIGVDVNQDGLAPGRILSSTIKRVDNAVYNLIWNFLNGKFKPGKIEMNLANNGVSLTDFRFTMDTIGKSNLKKLSEIENKIRLGKIIVPNYLNK